MKVTVQTPAKIAGQRIAPGTTIDVAADIGESLVRDGIATAAPDDAAAKPVAAPAKTGKKKS